MQNLMAIIYTLENVKRFLKHNNKVQWWYKRIRSACIKRDLHVHWKWSHTTMLQLVLIWR